jgi:multimeric flavodoxin WrbA
MRAVIVNGSQDARQHSREACEIIEEELRRNGWEVDSFALDPGEESVPACFRCWIEHPGICTRDDSGRRVPATFVRGDMAIILSPVSGGGIFIGRKKGT